VVVLAAIREPVSGPIYCDRIVRRFETLTGKQARLAATGESFEDVAAIRAETAAEAVEELA